jgi:hypothetical protein
MMHISYVKLFRDEDGIIRDTQEANGELRFLHHQIALLKDALEREMETVDNLHELLKGVRRIALELNNEILKEDYAKTKE